MKMELYKVGANGRVALGALAGSTEFYAADRDPATGVITLAPVEIVPPTGGRKTETTDVAGTVIPTGPAFADDDPDTDPDAPSDQ